MMKPVKASKTHLDTEEQGDKEDRNGEENEEHEEPGTPVQPVAQTHHSHVFLENTFLKNLVLFRKFTMQHTHTR